MNQNRKDKREPTRDSGSVMDNKESFEHGSGVSDMAKGMGSSGERGMGSSDERPSSRQKSGGITNRGLDEERHEQSKLPERGRSQSEE